MYKAGITIEFYAVIRRGRRAADDDDGGGSGLTGGNNTQAEIQVSKSSDESGVTVGWIWQLSTRED